MKPGTISHLRNVRARLFPSPTRVQQAKPNRLSATAGEATFYASFFFVEKYPTFDRIVQREITAARTQYLPARNLKSSKAIEHFAATPLKFFKFIFLET